MDSAGGHPLHPPRKCHSSSPATPFQGAPVHLGRQDFSQSGGPGQADGRPGPQGPARCRHDACRGVAVRVPNAHPCASFAPSADGRSPGWLREWVSVPIMHQSTVPCGSGYPYPPPPRAAAPLLRLTRASHPALLPVRPSPAASPLPAGNVYYSTGEGIGHTKIAHLPDLECPAYELAKVEWTPPTEVAAPQAKRRAL